MRVSAISDRLIVVVLQYNVAELTVWHIFDDVPLHWELSTPFVLFPVLNALHKIHRSYHLNHTTELRAPVYRKQKKHWARLFFLVLWPRVKLFVGIGGASPYIVLDALVDVVFTVRLDYEELSVIVVGEKVMIVRFFMLLWTVFVIFISVILFCIINRQL